MRNGDRYEHQVVHASGTVDNPMSDVAIEGKFLANAAPVIGQERVSRILEAVWQLERLGNIRDLLALCA
jgi:2-methylcitrate dehydratase PrpD